MPRHRVHTTSFVVVVAALLTACGGGGGGNSSAPQPDNEPSQAMLRVVSDERDLLNAMETAYTSATDGQNRVNGNVAPAAGGQEAALDSSSGSGNYSVTYTQESGVDEIDVVKYDGEHLYIVPSLQSYCCYFLATPGIATEDDTAFAPELPPESQTPSAIRILSTDSDAATAEEVGQIPLDADQYVQGIYLIPEQQGLVTLGTKNFYGNYGGHWLDIMPWYQQHLQAQFYDVSQPESPVLSWSLEVEGGFVDSRRIGNTLYFVSRHTPSVDGLIYYPSSEQDFQANRNTFKSLSKDDLIPTVTLRSGDSETSRPLFSPQDCLVSNEAVIKNEAAGYPTLTSITAISLDDPLNPQTVCYNESAAGMYMSTSALYLTDVRYQQSQSITRIHKFALGNGKPDYRGSAEIAGYLWSGGQHDFRLSESGGMLRLMTTQNTGDQTDRLDHFLYVLEESSADKTLELVSQLPNTQRPEEIGKANEGLYGVRFAGDRAYAVTFEQIDPLYVIDLSDPVDPFIAGALEVPGFSDFLHPVGDQLLLGLGRSRQWNGQVKLELFDVSEPTQPVSRGSSLIGTEDGWNWSEAQYNRHAFSYLAGDSDDRFAVPLQSSGNSPQGNYYNEEALYLFEISNKNNAAAASLDQQGRVVAEWTDNGNWYGGYRHRSVLDGDAVYFISGDYVWSARWDTPAEVTGPQ